MVASSQWKNKVVTIAVRKFRSVGGCVGTEQPKGQMVLVMKLLSHSPTLLCDTGAGTLQEEVAYCRGYFILNVLFSHKNKHISLKPL